MTDALYVAARAHGSCAHCLVTRVSLLFYYYCVCGAAAHEVSVVRSQRDSWVNIDERCNDIWHGKVEDSRCFVHHKFHIDRPEPEPGPPRWETGD
jgi:hypothetical protein